MQRKIKTELYNDHFENSKRYNIPRAQLIIADIPYNLGNNAYGSSPAKKNNLSVSALIIRLLSEGIKKEG